MRRHLCEAELAPNIKGAIKREYKRLDNLNDSKTKLSRDMRKDFSQMLRDKNFRNAPSIRKDIDASGGMKNYVKKMFQNVDKLTNYGDHQAHKITQDDLWPQGIEAEKYPYYVSVYDKYPIYEPAEGGYYYEGRQIVGSKGFNSYDEAQAYAEELFKEEKEYYGKGTKFSDGVYECDGRYIGEGVRIAIENNKAYTRGESGRVVYESYLRENKFSAGRHISYPLSILLRSSIEDGDYEVAKTSLILGYKQIHNIVPNVFTESDMKSAIDEIEATPTEVSAFEGETVDDPEKKDSWEASDAETAREDDWNYLVKQFFDTCDSLGIYVCTEGDQYKDEGETLDTVEEAINDSEYVYFACGKDACDGPFTHEEAWDIVKANPDKYDSVVERLAGTETQIAADTTEENTETLNS